MSNSDMKLKPLNKVNLLVEVFGINISVPDSLVVINLLSTIFLLVLES